jgi:hypothetical protein
MVISRPLSKALAGLTLALLASALTTAPSLAHKAKPAADSSSVLVKATVLDVCSLQHGQSITLPTYYGYNNSGGGPVNFNLGYYCTLGGSPGLVSFQTGYAWTGISDCSALISPYTGQYYLFYAIWYQGNRVNCNPGSDPGAGQGITNAPPGNGFNQESFLNLSVGVDLNFDPPGWLTIRNYTDPAGTYVDYLTVNITP